MFFDGGVKFGPTGSTRRSPMLLWVFKSFQALPDVPRKVPMPYMRAPRFLAKNTRARIAWQTAL